MAGKLEVSFNSPQCGWMSIGFSDGTSEFHTTTAHAPHASALPELMGILASLADPNASDAKFTLHWNRDPEEFDFQFLRDGEKLDLRIYQFPTEERDAAGKQLVFQHAGTVPEIADAFAVTFDQLYADRGTDEFEFNWRQPFPIAEYEKFKTAIKS